MIGLNSGHTMTIEKKKYTYDYPMPAITVDAVILTAGHVLLIKRRDDPFKGHWALPGGFMNIDESLLAAVIRETREETGLDISECPILPVGYFDEPTRDHRGRVVSFAFVVGIPFALTAQAVAGDDAADFGWYPIEDLPKLAFDHEQIIKQSLEKWKDQS